MLSDASCVVFAYHASRCGSRRVDSQNRHDTVDDLWPGLISWAPVLGEDDIGVAWRVALTRTVVVGG